MFVLRLAVLLIASFAALAATQTREVDLVLTNGIVVTMDGSRRVVHPGSVAIAGNTIVDKALYARDGPTAIRARLAEKGAAAASVPLSIVSRRARRPSSSRTRRRREPPAGASRS